MRLTPHNSRIIAEGLDHPECVCVDQAGTLYAGGEAGQIYRINGDGTFRELTSTGGFILGLTPDGDGTLYACDCGRYAVSAIRSDGQMAMLAEQVDGEPLSVPNYSVFDRDGNLYVSDSGDYWNTTGNGRVLKISPRGEPTVFHAGPFQFANGLAIDPTGQWLYIVQSTASNVARVALAEPHSMVEVTHHLPEPAVPDGIAFTSDGRLLVACYKPDAIYLGEADGRVTLLYEDPTGELLNRPTNVCLTDGKLYVANLGGWHITVIDTDLIPAPQHYPHFADGLGGRSPAAS